MSPDDKPGGSERPDYKVYRSRPGIFSRFRRNPLGSGVPKPERPAPDGGRRPPRAPRTSRERGEPAGGSGFDWRRGAKWTGIAALGWILVSLLAFAISAQIQKSKLADMGSTLHGNPFMLASPQTVLVLGTDVRPPGLASSSEATPQPCIDAASKGETPPSSCSPYRSDTIMLIRAGGGTFRKLSIPRDTYTAIPGQSDQKINAGYAFGGAKLETQTIESFLGINIDQVAIVDFNGFRDLIDSVGGITVHVTKKICSEISGGAANGGFSLFLDPGDHTLNSDQALTLARTRENVPTDPQGNPCPAISDLDRAQFQQDVISGIKDRLTSISRLPYNFLHGPFIGWNAPKAFVSSMGILTLPQFVLSSAIGGSGTSDVLMPSGPGPIGSLLVSHSECVRAVTRFLGGAPPHDPACSPGG